MTFNENDYVELDTYDNFGNLTIFKGQSKDEKICLIVSDGKKSILFKGPEISSKDCDVFISSAINSLKNGNFNKLFEVLKK